MRSPRSAAAFVPILATLLSVCPAHALPPGPIQFGQPTSVSFAGRGLQLAQVDGAGGPDVVSMDGGNLHVWRNTAGQLSAAHDSVLMAPGAQIISYFVADLDGDGTPDLAATTSASELVVRRGLGWPSFAAVVPYGLTTVANGLCAGDLDGDGRPELVASQPDSGTIVVFRNLGGGAFTQWARYVFAGPANTPWSSYPMRDVAIAECNGDSHPDVIANVHEDYASHEAIAVLLNQGDGSLGLAVKSLAFWGPRADLQAGDLNGDGLADAVIGSEGGAYAILLGNGGGQMALIDSLDTGSSWKPARSAIVDMNGDGTLDLVTGRYLTASAYQDVNSVVVWTGVGNGHFVEPVECQTAYWLSEFVVGDLEGDGAPDVVVATRNDYSWIDPDSKLWVHRGLDDGLVVGYRNLLPTGPCSDPWCYWSDLVVAAGASALGQPADLFHSAGGHHYWRRNLGAGAMAPEVDLGLGRLASVRDLNHDGRVDIVLALPGAAGIRLSVADGAWNPHETYLGGRYFGLADIDGDGELDLAQAAEDGHLWWRRGSQAGTFGDPTWTAFLVREADQHFPEFACLGDVDNDGRADLVSVTTANDYFAVATVLRFRTDGNLDTLASFDVPPMDLEDWGYEAGWRVRPYIAASGGGRPPILLFVHSDYGSGGGGRLNSFRREPDGSYVLASSLPTPRNEPQGLGIADFDLDGIEDVALTCGADFNTGSLFVYRCDESGVPTEQWTGYPGSYPGIARPADFDGDSKPDLFVPRAVAHRIGIFTNVTMTDQPTPTLIALVSAQFTPEGVALDWFAPGSDAAGVLLERSAPAVDWTSIARLTADGDGHYRFVDRDVVEGARYGYRLRISGAEGDATWVTIPARRGLQLLGVLPNPATENARVRFILPRESEVRIEVLDILGRRRGASPPARLSAGTHELPIPSRGRLAPGVYLLRLSAGGETFTRRFAATQ